MGREVVHGDGRAEAGEETYFCGVLTTFRAWLSLGHLLTTWNVYSGKSCCSRLKILFLQNPTVSCKETCKEKAWALARDGSGLEYALLNNSCETLSSALLL